MKLTNMILIILLCGMVGIGIYEYAINGLCTHTYETTKVTDIIQISAGGFSSPTLCILQTEAGKISLTGSLKCKSQIGDTLIRRTDNCSLLKFTWSRQ